jgi:hypothetical protein
MTPGTTQGSVTSFNHKWAHRGTHGAHRSISVVVLGSGPYPFQRTFSARLRAASTRLRAQRLLTEACLTRRLFEGAALSESWVAVTLEGLETIRVHRQQVDDARP